MTEEQNQVKSADNDLYTLSCGVKRARFIDGKWQPQYRRKLFGFIPLGWQDYGYEFGDSLFLGLGLTPYRFDSIEECVRWLNAA